MARLLGQKALCIITGASRGIGNEIAAQFSTNLGDKSVICLTARDSAKLAETSAAIRNSASIKGHELRVICHSVDLESAGNAEIDELLDKLAIEDERFDVFMLVNNAGSIQCEKLSCEFNDITETDSYFRLNFSSTVTLTSKCLSRFSNSINNAILIVNISSVFGTRPFSGSALYGAVKAARDLYFATLAQEYNDGLLRFGPVSGPHSPPTLRVLSYTPGPVRTDMARHFCERTINPQKRESWESRLPKLITCEQTVAKLLKIVQSNAFKSGARIDYFDDESNAV